MSALRQPAPFVSVEEYLAAEEVSHTRHEYLDGFVYEMAGASDSQIRVARNLARLTDEQLEGRGCEFVGNDMKLMVSTDFAHRYYYPDGMVVCDPKDGGNGFREKPTIVFEILSASTRTTDDREKKIAYHRIESVQAYVRIEQEHPEVIVEVRTGGQWERWQFTGLETVAELGALDLKLPLSRLYARVVFTT